jgi:hypothetical protein
MATRHSIPSNILDIVHETNLLKVKSVVSHNSKIQYNIVSYKKDMLTADAISTYGKYRSVIINEAGAVVGFAPPKSIMAETFMATHPITADANNENMVAEEFVEGTMLNVFFNAGVWEVATKQTIGANVRFYTNNVDTFYSMFLDAMQNTGLTFDMLDKKNSYSFVLQHPKNRIVVPFQNATLYLVAVYQITFVEETKMYDIVNVGVSPELALCVKTPAIYDGWETYEDLIQQYASINTPYECLGFMMRDRLTGERAKIRNPVYERVRRLRGNQPKLMYHYLCLRKEGKVGEFLNYFPEHKQAFASYRNQMHIFTQNIFQYYIQCYMKKTCPLIDFPPQYRPHMFNLHKTYIDTLKEQQQHITKAFVIAYVNDLHPSQQMYWLNHNITG